MSQFYKDSLRSVEVHRGRPTAIMSGCAYGIDTDVLRAALELWPGILVRFAVPNAPYNHAQVDFISMHYDGPIEEHFVSCQESSVGKRYMARNQWMADNADELAAYPNTSQEQLRSGTWSTVRRFRKLDKPVYLFPTDEGPHET